MGPAHLQSGIRQAYSGHLKAAIVRGEYTRCSRGRKIRKRMKQPAQMAALGINEVASFWSEDVLLPAEALTVPPPEESLRPEPTRGSLP